MTIYGLGTSTGKFKLFISRISIGYENIAILSPAVFCNVPVNRNCYESVGPEVFELNDLMAFAGELSPSAGLSGVLFDSLLEYGVVQHTC